MGLSLAKPAPRPVTLRAYRDADRAACQALAARAAWSSYAAHMPDHRESFTASQPLEAADERILAVWDGAVLGFVELVGAHVSNLFVDPEHQGRGIGALLICEAERRVADDLTLSVFTVNGRARRLYERLGFEVVGTGRVPFGCGDAEVWRMRKLRRPIPRRYRLIIFDFDGTLADSAGWMTTVLGSVAREFGFREPSRTEIERLRGCSTREILKRLQVPMRRVPAIAARLRVMSREAADAIPLFPGVVETLRELGRLGPQLAIVSSNGEETVRAVLRPANAALIEHFACGASLLGKARKLGEVLRRAGVTPAHAVAVGDETRDVEAARTAGVAAAAVSWGYATPTALEASAPDFLFDGLPELRRVLAA